LFAPRSEEAAVDHAISFPHRAGAVCPVTFDLEVALAGIHGYLLAATHGRGRSAGDPRELPATH
jgi:hypothetical protein